MIVPTAIRSPGRPASAVRSPEVRREDDKGTKAVPKRERPRSTVGRWPTSTPGAGVQCRAVVASLLRGRSMQRQHAVQAADLRRPDQTRMRDGDRVKRSIELAPPESEEILEHRKARRHVVLLPDEGLQDAAVIRHAIQD